MPESVTREDVLDILEVFRESAFAQLQLSCGSVRISVNRVATTSAHSGQGLSDTVQVMAPLIGAFQSGPAGGSIPFIQSGDEVEPDTTVGIIRVLENLTEVKAGVCGTVLEVVAKDGEFVEFGQPLVSICTESKSGDSRPLRIYCAAR